MGLHSASSNKDNGPSSSNDGGSGGALATIHSNNKNNWDMINQTIKEHPDNSWYVPKEERCNAWTCDVMFTPGNIELRDFELKSLEI
jgi:hypothetical protein